MYNLKFESLISGLDY